MVTTATATFDTAVEAIKRGAQNYLPKPFTPAQIRHLRERLSQRCELLHRALYLEERLKQALPKARLETGSPAMADVLKVVARAARRAVPEFTPAAVQALTRYQWPGKIRELHNALERALVLAPGPDLETSRASPSASPRAVPRCPCWAAISPLSSIEEEHISRVTARTKTLQAAAAILSVDASTLWRCKKRKQEGQA